MLILLGETGETANLSLLARRLCQPSGDETIRAKSAGLAILFFQQRIASVKVKGRDLSPIGLCATLSLPSIPLQYRTQCGERFGHV